VSGYAEHARLVADARRLTESDEDRLPECWSGLAQQELLALPFDGTLVDVCVVIEELGRALAPGPVVSTLLAGVLVRHHGDDALRTTVEQGLRDGSVSFAVAVDDVLLGGSGVSHVLLPVDGGWHVVDASDVET